MKRTILVLVAVAALTGLIASLAHEAGHAAQEAAPVFVKNIPPGYRDWKVVSVVVFLRCDVAPACRARFHSA